MHITMANMAKHIVIIQGHPDATARHFGHALADEYAKGAQDGGHEVQRIEVAALDFPLLRTKEDFEKGQPPDSIKQAQEAIKWASHLVIIYPLWLGSMPALLKAFLEQVFRPGFAFEYQASGKMARKLLTGKSARIVVSMGMPALIYRWFFFAHSLKNLQRNILGFSGIKPVRSTLIGSIEGLTDRQRADWLDTLRSVGEEGQ
ncbi:MAG TPA: NAD(P)H-dependent oxidoreductase [Nitrospira sp.]|nr:NAD(P)H-dependent oxidoreductase [Nitrospira sp.]